MLSNQANSGYYHDGVQSTSIMMVCFVPACGMALRATHQLRCLDHMEKKWIVQFILLCTGLGKIAESLKEFGPYRQLSRYDRTRITGSNSLIIHKCWIYFICSVG